MASEMLEALMNANMAASAAILLILALRGPVRRVFGARAAYALWILVLCAPAAGLLPAPSTNVMGDSVIEAHRVNAASANVSAQPVMRPPSQQLQDVTQSAAAFADESKSSGLLSLFALIWIAGIVISAGLLATRQLRFRRALGVLRPARVERNIYLSESISHGPLVAGILTPKIILPADFASRFNREESLLVLAHERVHVNCRDTQINFVVAFMQCLNWFNPFIHVAAFHIRLDQELACDADVVTAYPDKRRAYGTAMLKNVHSLAVAPLGCAWPSLSAHLLKKRITLLGGATPARTARRAGIGIAVLIGLAGGYVSWAMPKITYDAAAASPATAGVGNMRSLASTISYSAAGCSLLERIERGDVAAAKQLLAAGADPNCYVAGDGTPLVEAAGGDSIEALDLLLKAGADPNLTAPGDGNPLIVSSANGNVVLMSLLVAHGANVNAVVYGDETPLINASRGGHAKAVSFLIGKGADVNLGVRASTRMVGEFRSPLGMAIRNHHREVADLLRSAGAKG